jgi:hypothetical protein
MKLFRIAAVTSSNFNNYELLADKLDLYLLYQLNVEFLVKMSNFGSEKLVERYAKVKSHKITQFAKDNDAFGKMAEIQQAHKLVENCDALIIFCERKSDKNMVLDICRKANKPFRVVPFFSA